VSLTVESSSLSHPLQDRLLTRREDCPSDATFREEAELSSFRGMRRKQGLFSDDVRVTAEMISPRSMYTDRNVLRFHLQDPVFPVHASICHRSGRKIWLRLAANLGIPSDFGERIL